MKELQLYDEQLETDVKELQTCEEKLETHVEELQLNSIVGGTSSEEYTV